MTSPEVPLVAVDAAIRVNGGVVAWRKAGRPVVAGGARQQTEIY